MNSTKEDHFKRGFVLHTGEVVYLARLPELAFERDQFRSTLEILVNQTSEQTGGNLVPY